MKYIVLYWYMWDSDRSHTFQLRGHMQPNFILSEPDQWNNAIIITVGCDGKTGPLSECWKHLVSFPYLTCSELPLPHFIRNLCWDFFFLFPKRPQAVKTLKCNMFLFSVAAWRYKSHKTVLVLVCSRHDGVKQELMPTSPTTPPAAWKEVSFIFN